MIEFGYDLMAYCAQLFLIYIIHNGAISWPISSLCDNDVSQMIHISGNFIQI